MPVWEGQQNKFNPFYPFSILPHVYQTCNAKNCLEKPNVDPMPVTADAMRWEGNSRASSPLQQSPRLRPTPTGSPILKSRTTTSSRPHTTNSTTSQLSPRGAPWDWGWAKAHKGRPESGPTTCWAEFSTVVHEGRAATPLPMPEHDGLLSQVNSALTRRGLPVEVIIEAEAEAVPEQDELRVGLGSRRAGRRLYGLRPRSVPAAQPANNHGLIRNMQLRGPAKGGWKL